MDSIRRCALLIDGDTKANQGVGRLMKTFLFLKLLVAGLALVATNAVGTDNDTLTKVKDAFALNEVTLEEARTFLKAHLPKAFPGSEVTTDRLIKVDTFNAQKIICYGVECWPIRKERGEIIDLATETARGILPVRVEFRQINSEQSTSQKKHLQEKVFALTLSDTNYIANILRFLDGYSFYAGYNLKFVARDNAAALPAYEWVAFQYFENGVWHDNSEVKASFENIGKLEEIYDGNLALLGSAPADKLKTSGYWHSEFAEISPWSQTIDAIVKDGNVVANLSDVNLLPEGPRFYKTRWIYP